MTTTTEELLRQAEEKSEAARILIEIGREMLHGVDQQRLIDRGKQLLRQAAELRAAARARSPE